MYDNNWQVTLCNGAELVHVGASCFCILTDHNLVCLIEQLLQTFVSGLDKSNHRDNIAIVTRLAVSSFKSL